MKEWFKHDRGYVNIDTKNIYFTESGNWSETPKLKEKTKKEVMKIVPSVIVSVIIIFIAILSVFVDVSSEYSLLSKGFVLVSGAIMIYRIYNFFKSDIGVKMKIPLIKIQQITIEEYAILIYYLNGNGKDDVYQLTSIENKGKDILKKLKEIHQL